MDGKGTFAVKQTGFKTKTMSAARLGSNGSGAGAVRENRAAKLILVVDDDPMFRRDVCGFLEDEGFRTVAAWNGREAFGLLLTALEVPSLIILDLVMDAVDGPEFRRRQRQKQRLAEIPVLIVSGDPDGELTAKALHAAGFLGKPLDADKLVGEIDRILETGPETETH
ncbi:MAG: response regulator [Planctomycetota bacterium]